jgi:hypothetical protein
MASRKAKEPQSGVRGNKPRPIHDEMRTQSAHAFSRAGFSDPTLLLHWREIAGEETARIATPVRLTNGTDGGTLTVKAEPGAALFLQHESPALIARVNAFLGRPAVAKLRFVQAPLIRTPPSKPRPQPRQKQALSVKEPARRFQGPERVREALLRLAEARQRDQED